MRAYNRKRSTPLLLWPFKLVWDVLALLLKLTGRFIGVIVGLVFMVVGIILTLSVLGAVLGLPLLILGFLLVLRSLF